MTWGDLLGLLDQLGPLGRWVCCVCWIRWSCSKVATVSKFFANSPIRQIANSANHTDSRIQAVAAAKISINFGKVAAAAEISAVSRRPTFRQCHAKFRLSRRGRDFDNFAATDISAKSQQRPNVTAADVVVAEISAVSSRPRFRHCRRGRDFGKFAAAYISAESRRRRFRHGRSG